jgi:hypothetical protein
LIKNNHFIFDKKVWNDLRDNKIILAFNRKKIDQSDMNWKKARRASGMFVDLKYWKYLEKYGRTSILDVIDFLERMKNI